MRKPPIPSDEDQRIATLQNLSILDTPLEERFDRITRIASRLFNVPIALISFIDSNRQWIKSRQGLSITEIPRSDSFCGYAILSGEILVVPDAKRDPRFSENPMVNGPPFLRFYAGCPLAGPDGRILGTLSVLDRRPRRVSKANLKSLKDLASMAEEELRKLPGGPEDTLKESEERFRMLAEAAPIGLFLTKPTGECIYTNPVWSAISGRSSEESLGYKWMQAIHPDDRGKVDRTWRTAAARGENYTADYRIIRPGGNVLWVHVLATPQMDASKTIVGYVGSVEDITERRQTQEALQESQRTFATLLGNFPGLVYRCRNDRDWTTEFVSKGALSLTGYSPSDFMEGRVHMGQLIHPDDRESVWSRVQTALNEKRPYQLTYRFRPASGEEKWVLEQGQGIFSATGELLFLEGFVSDITEQKRTEKALQENEARLRAIIDHEPECVKLVDRDGNLIQMNPAGLRMIEAESLDQVEGHCVFPLAAEEYQKAYRRLHERVMQGESGSLVFDIISLKGTRRTLETHETPLRDSSGSIFAALGITRDITERKQAEEALRKNEERLRLVGRATHDAVWDWDLAANTVWWNENATALFGCKAEEIEPTLAWWESRIHPEDKARVLSDLQAMFDRGERFFSTEYRFRRGDGSDATVFDRGYVLHDRDGKPVRMIGAMMDITERKQAEEAMKESHERLQRALEASQTGTWRVDLRTGMDTRDASLNRMLGLPSEPSTQPMEDWFLYVHPDDLPAIRSAWEKGLVSGLYNMEHRLVRRDGRVLWVYDRGVIVRDDAGQLLYAIGAAMDITERKRAEEEIRRLNQDLERRVVERTAQLEAVNKELESFSYSVSHDLRAPLRATAGFSRVLLNRYADRLDAQGRDFLQRIDAASRRMGELIEDLLNLSRIARRDMRKEPFDLAALARSIATEIQKADPNRKVTFLIQDHLKAEGDPRLLRIVLENLLGNAWKFTSKRPKATIEFGQVEQEGRPVYFVRDNGAGFDMAYADKLFGAFQRLHSQSEFEGTGIGLATVQRIIHRHGGKVWAEGEIEKGATFFFTL